MKTPARLLAALLLLPACAPALAGTAPAAAPVALPGVAPHAGFDDMGYVPELNRVVVPGGDTGALYLIAPADNAVTRLAQAAPAGPPKGRHDAGTTSAAYVDGYFVASDHPAQALSIVDAKTGKVAAHVPLAAGSDYVRYFAPVHQLWVTEPDAQQIQVFTVHASSGKLRIAPAGTISVPGGPEALVLDARRDRAYTNLWKQETLAIDVKTRKVVAHWRDGCEGPRGLALAPRHDLLFVGCSEGKATALDLAHGGKVVASAATGAGVDIIAWNPALQHLYVPGARSATLTILALAPGPRLRSVTTVATAKGAHCVATDGKRKAYVCDPAHGRVLAVTDSH